MVDSLSSRHTKGILLGHFKKTTVLLLILLIVLISLTLRYPLVDHERHNDTFFNRLLADSILENDYAGWTFHPLSYIGYYPLSYPSGNPFLLAEISEMTAVGLSPSILILGMVCGILFALSVFCISRILLKRIDLCILATTLAVLAPRYIDTSYWNGSARAPFVALALLVVFIASRAGSPGRPALVVVLGIMVIGCFTLHRMAIVLVLFFVAYMLSALLAKITLSIASKGSLIRTGKWFTGFSMVFLGIAISLMAFFYLSYYEPMLEHDYGSTSLFSSEPVYISTFLNMAASYTHQIGLILPIAMLSIPIYFMRTRITATSLFPILLIISFIPLLPSAQYISMILSPFIAVLGVAWFGMALKRKRWRRIVMAGLVIVICASLVLPVWSTQRWNSIQETSGDPIASDLQLFTDATYLREFDDSTYAISNNDILSARLSGVSGVIFLKSGVISALSGDVTAESVQGNLSWTNRQFPFSLYIWFEYDDRVSTYVTRYLLWGNLFPAGDGDVWQGEDGYFETHSRLLVVVDNRWPTSYAWVWGVQPASLPLELRTAQWGVGSATYPLQSYSIYSSERMTLYATEVPNKYG